MTENGAPAPDQAVNEQPEKIASLDKVDSMVKEGKEGKEDAEPKKEFVRSVGLTTAGEPLCDADNANLRVVTPSGRASPGLVPRPALACALRSWFAPCPHVAEADELRAKWGKNELEEKSVPKWLIFVKGVSVIPCPCLKYPHHGAFLFARFTPHRVRIALICLQIPHARPQLYQPMPIMIWIAIIIELALQNWIDAGILLAIQFINAFLGW